MAAKEEKKQITAERLAEKQRDIGVAEFFARNRHLLGFDNKRKALLMTVKEAVDNALDACEEAKILPEVSVELIDMQNDRYRVIVEDNGPGIVKKQVPNIFAKLLYGSKFHTLKQSLAGDEPIILRQDGKIKISKIGDIIDKYLDGEGEIECCRMALEVPSFDWKGYKYSFRPVSHLIKHKRRNEIYKITTRYGKHIKVTGCHSIFTVNKETFDVKEVQARDLKKNDIILAPKRIAINENKNTINILDYIDEEYATKRCWYLYVDNKTVKEIFSQARIVHSKKAGSKSRKYYQFCRSGRTVDVLDDSYKQYAKKGFVPVWLAKFLGMQIDEGIIKTYFHGKEYNVPIIWSLTDDFMKFIGLFAAEGHTDSRQIGFTFSRCERDLVNLVGSVGFVLGADYTVEERHEKNCVRVKIFGGLLSYLLRKWCGHGAKNKKLPDFVFSASHELRQDCLDYLYVGDGHNTKNRNQLMLSTVSEELANQVVYLWLMQGVVSSCVCKPFKGYGREASKSYIVSVYGDGINTSNYFNTQRSTKRRACNMNLRLIMKMLGISQTQESLSYLETLRHLQFDREHSRGFLQEFFNTQKIGYKLRFMVDNCYLSESGSGNYFVTQKTQQICGQMQKLKILLDSDFAFLPIKNVEIINSGHDFVYDISVPENENFVGGFGAIACHNSRGQQGIGISAAALYGQLTTGRPIKILSKIAPGKPAYYCELHIDTKNNRPEILKEEEKDWNKKEHGTRIELDIEATYLKGPQSVDQYLKETAIVNPHVTIIYTTPKAEQFVFPRAVEQLPKEPMEIKPHPYGIELGVMIKMLMDTECRTLQSFLTQEFSRVGPGSAKEICEKAALPPNTKPSEMNNTMAERLVEGIKKTKLISPPTDCISPITAEQLEKGLKKEIKAEFFCSITRTPDVYRGNPFIIEAAIAYGGELPADHSAEILRFANRVPLLYQQGACAANKAIVETNWRPYGLNQSQGSVPQGPVIIIVHLASVWAPFTSEAKEAIAHYPEIIKEMKLALQECGRMLGSYVNKKKRVQSEYKKRGYIEKYLPHVGIALKELLDLNDTQERKVVESLKEVLESSRTSVELETVEGAGEDGLGLEFNEETEPEPVEEEENGKGRKGRKN